MKKQILVPLDLSNESKIGLEVAVRIAKKIDADINVLHVIEEENAGGFYASGDIEQKIESQGEHSRYIIELIKKRQDQLLTFLQPFGNGETDIKSFIDVGQYVDCIQTNIRENPAELIVMGTTGEKSYTEIFTGNHAEQTVEETHIPVLSVKEHEDLDNLSTIGLIVDLEDPNDTLIKLVRKLTNFMNLDVVMLHGRRDSSLSDDDLISKLMIVVGEYGLNIKAVKLFDSDKDIIDSLETAIEIYEIGLIAKTTKNTNGFQKLFLENITEELINELDEPVLLMSN